MRARTQGGGGGKETPMGWTDELWFTLGRTTECRRPVVLGCGLCLIALQAIGCGDTESKAPVEERAMDGGAGGTGGSSSGSDGSQSRPGSGGSGGAAAGEDDDDSTAGQAGDAADGDGSADASQQADCEPGSWDHDEDPRTECRSCSVGEYCAGGSSAPVACGLKSLGPEWTEGDWDHDADPSTACRAWRDCGQEGLCERWRDCVPALGVGSATRDRPCFDVGWTNVWRERVPDLDLDVGLFPGSGDLLVAGGRTGASACQDPPHALRLASETGETVWEATLDAGGCECTGAVAPDGDVVVACGETHPGDPSVEVTKLAWEDGAISWEAVLPGGDDPRRIGFDENEDVMVLLDGLDSAVVVLSGETGAVLGEADGLPPDPRQRPTIWQEEAARQFDEEAVLPYLEAYCLEDYCEWSDYPSTWHIASDGDIVGYHTSVTVGGAWSDEDIVHVFRLDAFDASKVALQSLPWSGVSDVTFAADERMLLFEQYYPYEDTTVSLWVPAGYFASDHERASPVLF